MKDLLIDLETYSNEDITRTGAYRYVESDSFSILLLGYSADFADASCVDLALGESIPDEIVSAILDPNVRKWAHNMTFEIACLSKYFGVELDPRQWHDTMAYGAYLGLPLSLSLLGEVLHLEKQKLTEGRNLINFFSRPFKGNRRKPEEYLDKWNRFKEYCVRDVDTEVLVAKKVVGKIAVPEWERELQILDFNINRRGVRVDTNLARNAIRFWEICEKEFTEELERITGLYNPNSVTQLKGWLLSKGVSVDALDKSAVKELLTRDLPDDVRRVLELRRELAKTSVTKYEAMLDMICRDERARGITQYYGTFTGRWAGRNIQTQNLPQNHLKNLDATRKLLEQNDYDAMDMCFMSVPDTLSQLIRTALVPSKGNVFHVCDFSAIEARVTAWLSGEDWVLDAFRNGEDIYCVTASRMFGVPVTKHGEHSGLRQPGKVAVLACGYGGGPSAFDNMAKAYGLVFTEEEKTRYVKQWRSANPHTVKLWKTIGDAAVTCINKGNGGKPITVNRGVTFFMKYGFMFVTLPSGRTMSYPRVKLEDTEKGVRILYQRMNQTTRKWEYADTWGGKLVENIVQAIARDILAIVMMRAEKAGFRIVFHVHDELIVDSPKDRTLAELESFFSEPIPWAPNLPLKGAGYSGNYYFKD